MWLEKFIVVEYILVIASCMLPASNASMLMDYTDGSTICPVWSKSQHNCSCGPSVHHTVFCNETTIQIPSCFCMYYDRVLNKTIVGNCLYTCVNAGPLVFFPFERTNGVKFNHDMCHSNPVSGNMHRRGRFCGECEEGYGLAAYSYHFIHCINCTDYGYKNWLKYFAIGYLPLTVFYCLVIGFRIRVTSPPMSCFVTMCQFITMPTVMRIFTGALNSKQYGSSLYTHKEAPLLYLLFTVFGIWNLDFFRTVFTPFCLHPKFGALQVIALDYLIAVYPLLLILLTYILLELHDRNYRVLVWMWRPFKWCFDKIHSEWELRASLVDGFNSFLVMSYVKLLSVSSSLLVPTRYYDVNGTVSKLFLYYDANVELFSKEHLPYAILACVVLLVLVILPLVLLCLYPCRCFQRFLNCCGLRCQTLHIFMDSFQGYYRTTPYDCRYFAGHFLFLRIIMLLTFDLTLSISILSVFSVFCSLSAMITAAAQPYKQPSSNTADIFLLLILTFICIAFHGELFASYMDNQNFHSAYVMLTASLLIAFVNCVFLFLYRILNHRTLQRKMGKKLNDVYKKIINGIGLTSLSVRMFAWFLPKRLQ